LALLIFDRNLIPMPYPVITRILSISVSQKCGSLWPGRRSLWQKNIKKIAKAFTSGNRPRPKLKISLFPLTRPTLSKSADWKFYIGNLPSLFFSFRSKFVLLRIPYFRFVSPSDRYFRITEQIVVVKKKKRLPTYSLPKLWVR
jgi:hypothetical protein